MRIAFPVGLRYMAVGAFFFSIMSLLVKVAGAGLPTMEVVLVRSVVVLLISGWFIHRGPLGFRGVRRGLLLVRGVVGFIALSCFYYAVIHLPLADATVIQFTNPVWTSLLAALFIGEGLHARQVGLALLSLVGVLLVAQPTFIFGGALDPLDPFAVGVGLTAAVFSAGAYVTVRELRRTEHPMVIVWWFALVSTIGAAPLAAPDFIMPGAREWLVLVGVGVFTYLGQWMLTHSLVRERAGRATSVGYLQIVFAAVWGMLFFAEVPEPLGILGALLIVGSIIAVGGEGA